MGGEEDALHAIQFIQRHHPRICKHAVTVERVVDKLGGHQKSREQEMANVERSYRKVSIVKKPIDIDVCENHGRITTQDVIVNSRMTGNAKPTAADTRAMITGENKYYQRERE